MESMRQYADCKWRVCGSMRIANGEYAAVCGLQWRVCGSMSIAVKTMRQYAELESKSMRQYADRVVTDTRHPAVFTVCFQRDGLLLHVVGIE